MANRCTDSPNSSNWKKLLLALEEDIPLHKERESYKIEKQLKMVMAITEAFMCCSGIAPAWALWLQTI